LPDIGIFFPNTEAEFKDIDSQILLRRVVAELGSRGYAPANIDATLIAEKPKIYPRLGEIKAVLANSTGLSADAIGLKATTNEGLDDIGHGLAIAAQAVALIEKL
jgi:2-C-methyl-D-erythritol 2,4-cyclodiphosphate synthase